MDAGGAQDIHAQLEKRFLQPTRNKCLSLHLTHNNTQNKMSRCRPTPAALPHISMATSAMDPNHGAADPYESTAGAGWPGSLSPRLVPLVGPTNEDASKIKRGAGPRP